MKHIKLLNKLNSFQANDNSCKKVYCGTCGGLSRAIKHHITLKIREEINTELSKFSVNDFLNLGKWCDYLTNNYPSSVHSIYEIELKEIDVSDIQKLDYLLFHSRKILKNTPEYRILLDQGIQAAIKTSNDSLIETVAIILEDKILNYDILFKTALTKSKNNKNIHRVLYNSLREITPQVRGYVGNGTTSVHWW